MTTSSAAPTVIPVILAGGSGTRLWPLSRRRFPKQFLDLLDSDSLLQATAKRVHGDASWSDPWIICHSDHRAIAQAQLSDIGMTDSWFLIEPVARNTAPAIAAAAVFAAQKSPEAVLFILPADHVIRPTDAYNAAIEAGVNAARDGKLVTFGIEPSHPETGYGYIKGGSDVAPRVRAVDQFVEKPNYKKAVQLLDAGGYYWNSGMFMFRADRFLEELGRHEPDILSASKSAVAEADVADRAVFLDADAFASAQGISVDYAVMEKTDQAAVVPSAFDWSDIGAWDAVFSKSGGTDDSTVTQGPVFTVDTKGSLVRSFGPFVGVVGGDNLVVVATDDAVLVVDRDRCQDVKLVVEHLKSEKAEALLERPSRMTLGAIEVKTLPASHGRVREISFAAGSDKPFTDSASAQTSFTGLSGLIRVETEDGVEELAPGASVTLAPGTPYSLSSASADHVSAVLELSLLS